LKSSSHVSHLSCRIAGAGGRAAHEDLVKLGQIRIFKFDINGANIFLQVSSPLRPGDRNDIFALGKHPGQSNLRRRAAFGRSDLLQGLQQTEVSGQVLTLEARVIFAPVVSDQAVRATDLRIFPLKKPRPRGA
jgi:hypothetical protein